MDSFVYLVINLPLDLHKKKISLFLGIKMMFFAFDGSGIFMIKVI